MSYPSDLFRAIFTPGAPPALVIATNVSFALLQVTLLVLLFATRSYHLFFLSIMCVGLWGGINWFIVEVNKLNKIEAEAAEIRRVQRELETETEEKKWREDGYDDDDGQGAKASGVQILGEEDVERRKFVSEDEDEDDFEKVEKEDGYETEGRKAK